LIQILIAKAFFPLEDFKSSEEEGEKEKVFAASLPT
jgi:hypothetical protein